MTEYREKSPNLQWSHARYGQTGQEFNKRGQPLRLESRFIALTVVRLATPSPSRRPTGRGPTTSRRLSALEARSVSAPRPR